LLHQAGLSRRLGLGLGGASLLLLASIAWSAGGAAPAPASPVPAIRGEVDAEGLKALLAERKGRTVLVNFWATWCVPCREEFPDLDRLERELSPRGFSVVGISTDFASQTAAVGEFLQKMRPSFVNYRKKSGGDDQPFIEAVDPKWGGELPFSVLYGPDGSRVKTLSGKHSYADYRREVLAVLDGKGKGKAKAGS